MTATADPEAVRVRLLRHGLGNAGVCVMLAQAGSGIVAVENPPQAWPAAGIILAQGWQAIFDAATAERLDGAQRAVLDTGIPARVEVALRQGGFEPAWFDLRFEPQRNAADGVREAFVTVVETTDLRRREAALNALHYEVSHRSRNLLAILQSILGHTARHSGTIGEFERKFRGRIHAFAKTQDLITRSNWQRISFRTLLDRQIAGLSNGEDNGVSVQGDDPQLGPNSALHIGLALHELAVNSANFGVLADGAGRIVIDAGQAGNEMRISWTEELGQPSELVPGHGFGRPILEEIVARAINGNATYAIEPERITYKVNWQEPVSLPVG